MIPNLLLTSLNGQLITVLCVTRQTSVTWSHYERGVLRASYHNVTKIIMLFNLNTWRYTIPRRDVIFWYMSNFSALWGVDIKNLPYYILEKHAGPILVLCTDKIFHTNCIYINVSTVIVLKASEYDQAIPQSHTADQPMAPRGRATEQ